MEPYFFKANSPECCQDVLHEHAIAESHKRGLPGPKAQCVVNVTAHAFRPLQPALGVTLVSVMKCAKAADFQALQTFANNMLNFSLIPNA